MDSHLDDQIFYIRFWSIQAKKIFWKLEFDIKLIPYKGKTEWVEPTIKKIYECLNSKEIPKADPNCDFCNYVKAVEKIK